MPQSMNKLSRAEAGRKGGLAKGPQKSWILKLTPEERSIHMKKLAAIQKAKRDGNKG